MKRNWSKLTLTKQAIRLRHSLARDEEELEYLKGLVAADKANGVDHRRPITDEEKAYLAAIKARHKQTADEELAQLTAPRAAEAMEALLRKKGVPA